EFQSSGRVVFEGERGIEERDAIRVLALQDANIGELSNRYRQKGSGRAVDASSVAGIYGKLLVSKKRLDLSAGVLRLGDARWLLLSGLMVADAGPPMGQGRLLTTSGLCSGG